jgi:hypothetical protein
MAALRSVSMRVRHAGSAWSLGCQNSGLWCGSEALPEVDLVLIARNFDGPEQPYSSSSFLKRTRSLIVRPMHCPTESPSWLSKEKWMPPYRRETAAASANSTPDGRH